MAAATLGVIETQWGWYVTCTGGTGSPQYLSQTVGGSGVIPTQSIKLAGISCGGAATTDIITVQDGEGVLLYQGAAVINTVISLPLGGPIRVSGLQVGFAGATSGFCILYKFCG